MSKLLTVKETATRLGLQSSTIRKWILQRKLGVVRVGDKAIRIEEATVEEIIRRGTQPAIHAEAWR